MPVYDFRLRDSRTDELIPGARIGLYRNPNFTNELEGGVTDASGRLSVDTGAAIALAYTIRKEGYVRIGSTSIFPVNDVRMDSAKAKYRVTFFAGSGGDVSPKGIQTVDADAQIEATATPYSGYVFRAWVVDGEDYDTRSPFTFPIGRDGMNIVATFETEAEVGVKPPKKPGDGGDGVAVTTVVSGGIPWPFTWIEGVVNWFGQAWESMEKSRQQASEVLNRAVTDSLDATAKQMEAANKQRQEQIEANKGLGGLVWGGLIESLSVLMEQTVDESIKIALKRIPEALGHSPEYKLEFQSTLQQFFQEQTAGVTAPVHFFEEKNPVTPQEKAAGDLTLLKISVSAATVATWIGGVIAEVAGLGQLETVAQLTEIEASILGFASIGQAAVMIPLEQQILIRARQYYAAQNTPEIPGYQDLIEMVVKEVIPLDEFKRQMKYLGYAEDWSQKIWDKHFIPPSLTDILTAWRRGLIDETRVDELMILVDLDPRFKAIFDTRKYVTPTLSLARFMFETGAIDAAKVEEIIKLEGYAPEFVPSLVDYIVGFQGRRWRTRYLQALATGFVKGIRTEAEVHKAVLDAGYTEEVATWLIETSKVRAAMEKAKDVTEAPKLIGVGDLKRAYVRNLIDADKLRIDLQMRGYQTTDVDLLVKLLDEEKVVTSAGGAKVALSVPELMNAWRYAEITEDRVRIELQLRGLSLEEVNILVNTKKKQWSTPPEGE